MDNHVKLRTFSDRDDNVENQQKLQLVSWFWTRFLLTVLLNIYFPLRSTRALLHLLFIVDLNLAPFGHVGTWCNFRDDAHWDVERSSEWVNEVLCLHLRGIQPLRYRFCWWPPCLWLLAVHQALWFWTLMVWCASHCAQFFISFCGGCSHARLFSYEVSWTVMSAIVDRVNMFFFCFCRLFIFLFLG
jgi:hypothetical protein